MYWEDNGVNKNSPTYPVCKLNMTLSYFLVSPLHPAKYFSIFHAFLQIVI